MELIFRGKTKDVYSLINGNVRLFFKDDMTGKDGVFDPGENQIGLTVKGSGRSGLRVSQYFFEQLTKAGITTHYVKADLENSTMDVKKATVFGKGIEVICRFRAVGSFIKRYGAYIENEAPLDSYIEFTLKDDLRQDPLINEAGLLALNILKPTEYQTIVNKTKQIATIIQQELATKNLELYDIKLEFGYLAGTDEIALIDEISGGNMRVYCDGQTVHPLDLEGFLF